MTMYSSANTRCPDTMGPFSDDPAAQTSLTSAVLGWWASVAGIVGTRFQVEQQCQTLLHHEREVGGQASASKVCDGATSIKHYCLSVVSVRHLDVLG